MGSWRNRPRFYRQRAPRTPLESSYYDPNSPPYGSSDDGVPAWEKKFCWSVGSVPWRKVVQAKNFISCHTNVSNWDDSAAAEAFHLAKQRFWFEWSGIPSDISLPDPDMFIEDINWNSVIDPELIRDLEKEYFAPPDEGWDDIKFGHTNKKMSNSKVLPSEECDRECSNDVGTSDMSRNGNVSQGWNGWDSSVNKNPVDSNIHENPWERKVTQGNETSSTNAWGGFSEECDKGWESTSRAQKHKGWESKGWDYNNGSNEWEDKGWKSKGWNRADTSLGSNWHDDNKLHNVPNNVWGCKSLKYNEPRRDNGWQNHGISPRGRKTMVTNNAEQKKWEFKNPSDDWGDSTMVSRKREGIFGHNRNSRFKRHNDA